MPNSRCKTLHQGGTILLPASINRKFQDIQVWIYFCAKISCYLFVCLLDVMLVVIASGCNVQVSFCILECWWESFHLRSWQRRTTGTWQWKDSSGNFELDCTHDIVNSVTFITATCVDTCKLMLFLQYAPYFLWTWNICQWVYIDIRCQRIISLQDKALLKIIMITFFFSIICYTL